MAQISGRIADDGTIDSGNGFTVSKTGTGVYMISFDTPFSFQPAVLGTIRIGNTGKSFSKGTLIVSGTWDYQTKIKTYDKDGDSQDCPFGFLATDE